MLHYYMFSFAMSNSGFARVTIGWPDQIVTESRLAYAREKAIGGQSDVCPIAVSYLGQMTPEQAIS
ncbi:hypothetical protein [Rhizobium laguerreae]|uniref:hypothetical protein n=1 Tax=Rhizobium laguerreae TaxID=1076926 RepID=UPI0014791F66|nr:hypothetical protein [Rhizobium laguerreae]MBY3434791.1 hypothetical protein [Rhizobium laguerreae]MBY3448934.1 hypothetical protein [Rhizobium laguerreae]MBY3456708.1 hypothetical protein [Rhizobium laguerreae]NNH56879.1 hypothetical protein [Rhizobium laguerreae]